MALGRERVTIKDVAKQSGFSATTVSIVLNDRPLAQYIPATTKEQIKRAAETLSYRPNAYARCLRSRRSHTVGVMVFDITDPYCTHILRGIEDTLFQSSYTAVLTDIQNDRERFRRHLETLLGRQVEGLICLANSLSLEMELLAAVGSEGLPTVIIGREIDQDSIGYVAVDNEAGARAGLKHLHSLGHRRIAFIRGPKVLVDSAQRWRGIEAAARKVELKLNPKLVLTTKSLRPSFDEGFELTQKLLARRIPFTALMAFDDLTAFGAIRALNQQGLRVPQDCSVLGFDDVAMASFYNPPLSTVRQPMELLGSKGAEILVEGINAAITKSEVRLQHLRLVPQVVVRESTCSIPVS